MGGDHKCSVCQATFTRPQHVARHMRSHTGDRPYKCQCCGDQFARSDLLSRHITKCHADEKPAVGNGTTRRKGNASNWRATTSKQACDQCVQSSLPCDGSNPCVRCTQRKVRCTFVKFHRQTAPIGPGHNTPLSPDLLSSPVSNAVSTARMGMYSNQADEFLMNSAAAAAAGVSIPSSGAMPPMAADTLYASQGYSYPPIYSHHQQQQQHDPGAARHHRELLAHHPGAPSNIIPSMQPLSVYVSGNMDIRPGSSSSSTSSAAQSWMAWSPTQGNLGEEGFSTEGNALQASVQGAVSASSASSSFNNMNEQVAQPMVGGVAVGMNASLNTHSVLPLLPIQRAQMRVPSGIDDRSDDHDNNDLAMNLPADMETPLSSVIDYHRAPSVPHGHTLVNQAGEPLFSTVFGLLSLNEAKEVGLLDGKVGDNLAAASAAGGLSLPMAMHDSISQSPFVVTGGQPLPEMDVQHQQARSRQHSMSGSFLHALEMPFQDSTNAMTAATTAAIQALQGQEQLSQSVPTLQPHQPNMQLHLPSARHRKTIATSNPSATMTAAGNVHSINTSSASTAAVSNSSIPAPLRISQSIPAPTSTILSHAAPVNVSTSTTPGAAPPVPGPAPSLSYPTAQSLIEARRLNDIWREYVTSSPPAISSISSSPSSTSASLSATGTTSSQNVDVASLAPTITPTSRPSTATSLLGSQTTYPIREIRPLPAQYIATGLPTAAHPPVINGSQPSSSSSLVVDVMAHGGTRPRGGSLPTPTNTRLQAPVQSVSRVRAHTGPGYQLDAAQAQAQAQAQIESSYASFPGSQQQSRVQFPAVTTHISSQSIQILDHQISFDDFVSLDDGEGQKPAKKEEEEENLQSYEQAVMARNAMRPMKLSLGRKALERVRTASANGAVGLAANSASSLSSPVTSGSSNSSNSPNPQLHSQSQSQDQFSNAMDCVNSSSPFNFEGMDNLGRMEFDFELGTADDSSEKDLTQSIVSGSPSIHSSTIPISNPAQMEMIHMISLPSSTSASESSASASPALGPTLANMTTSTLAPASIAAQESSLLAHALGLGLGIPAATATATTDGEAAISGLQNILNEKSTATAHTATAAIITGTSAKSITSGAYMAAPPVSMATANVENQMKRRRRDTVAVASLLATSASMLDGSGGEIDDKAITAARRYSLNATALAVAAAKGKITPVRPATKRLSSHTLQSDYPKRPALDGNAVGSSDEEEAQVIEEGEESDDGDQQRQSQRISV